MPSGSRHQCRRLRAALFAIALLHGIRTGLAAPADVLPNLPANTPIFEGWGAIIARDQGVVGVELNENELSKFLNGFSAAIRGRPSPYDSSRIFSDVERMAAARREKIVRALELKNEAAAKMFFDQLKKNTNVVELGNGIRYETVRTGHGDFPRLNQTVNVHYTGRLLDGTEFMQYGPIDMVLVTNRSVGRGWTEAVQKINRGGALKLYVPPPLPKAEAARWGIEPGSATIIEIELFDFKATSPEDLANSTLPPAPDPEPPPPSGYTDLQIIEAWGWDVARQARADKCDLNETELASLVRALAAAIRGRPSSSAPSNFEPQVAQFVHRRLEEGRLKERARRLAEMETFFTELKKQTNVVELPDGLRYEILKPGTGPRPRPGQVVTVDYTGWLLDGTVFDKTYNEPLHIEVGSVIPGWNEGIQKINKGGRIKLYVPPSIGYGAEDMSGVVAPIPANSTLIYEIELLDLQDSPREAPVVH